MCTYSFIKPWLYVTEYVVVPCEVAEGAGALRSVVHEVVSGSCSSPTQNSSQNASNNNMDFDECLR